MASSWGRRSSRYSQWPAYVPVAQRQGAADKEVAALRKKGRTITPIRVAGRAITTTFWGKAWCDNLESYSDYSNRLPRGRSYARNGSIVHLAIGDGTIDALVRGTSLYTITLTIKPLAAARWSAVVERCAGEVTSLLELLGGKLSRGVMEIVTDKAGGIFPSPKEIALSCSCPDWATMCKHVAAAMYGVGARLDESPELLFRLRRVDPGELIAKSVGRAAAKATRANKPAIADSALGGIFGIDIEEAPAASAAAPAPKARAKAPASTTANANASARAKTPTKAKASAKTPAKAKAPAKAETPAAPRRR
jgi:uncharacterized Zn finger protein